MFVRLPRTESNPGKEVFITPTAKEVIALIQSDAEIIALDASGRIRPENELLEDLLAIIKDQQRIAIADISTKDEAVQAAKLGFDMIATTLSGYTEYTKAKFKPNQPDFQLIGDLYGELKGDVPVIAEGRIWNPEQAQQALACGAFAVVVGSAITRPHLITRRFVEAITKSTKHR